MSRRLIKNTEYRIAFLFIKVLSRNSGVYEKIMSKNTKSSTFLFSQFVYKKLGMTYNLRAAVFAITRMLDFFIRAGFLDAKIATICPKALIVDERAINNFVLSATSAVYSSDINFLSKRLSPREVNSGVFKPTGLDAFFLLDSQLPEKTKASIARFHGFVFGVASQPKDYLYLDFVLPIPCNAVETQYFIIELAFFGIGLGRKQKAANYQKLVMRCISGIKEILLLNKKLHR